MYTQWRLRSAWASAQSDQSLCCLPEESWVLSYSLSTQRRHWSDWANAQADPSLCWAHMPLCWFCHKAAFCSVSGKVSSETLEEFIHREMWKMFLFFDWSVLGTEMSDLKIYVILPAHMARRRQLLIQMTVVVGLVVDSWFIQNKIFGGKISTLLSKTIITEWWNRFYCEKYRFCPINCIWTTSWENLFLPFANNKGADQPAHPRSLISAFVVRRLDSIIPLLAISKLSKP